MKGSTYFEPPTLAIADGATTPNPGFQGAIVKSSSTGRLLEWTGSAWRTLSRIADFVTGLSAALTTPFTGAASNTTNQTFLSITIPAGQFPAAGATWRFRAYGAQSQSANANNVTFGVSVNGTVIVSAAVAAGAAAQTNRACDFEAEISFPVVGASGQATGGCKTTISATTPIQTTNTTPVTVNTTGSVTIALFCSNSTSNASNVIRVQSAEISPTAAVSGATGPTGPAGSFLSGLRSSSATADTVVLADAQGMVVATNASAISETIPPNASVAFPLLTTIYFEQGGSGQVSIVGGAGVTISTAAGSAAQTRTQGSLIFAIQKSINNWSVYGDTT